MRAALREEAVRLRREEELSYSEIRKRLKVPKSTLSYWLQDVPLSPERMLALRRSAWTSGEASREKFRETMRAKRDEYEKSVYERQSRKLGRISKQAFFVAGLMLYAAEGYKKRKYDIVFTNTDPAMVRLFVIWMKRFLDIDPSELKIQLRLYENMDISSEENFWLRALHMQRGQLYATRVMKLRPNSFTYHDTSRHGTCLLYKGSKDKKAELMLSIKAFFDRYKDTRA